MSQLAQGLQLSAVGILILFASLGVLLLVMVALRDLFKVKPSDRVEPDKVQVELLYHQEEMRIRAAAIAVSVPAMKTAGKHAGNLGALLESPSSRSRSIKELQ